MKGKSIVPWKVLDVNVIIRERNAQILIAGAVFVLALGIAWSFIKGMSTITVKTDLKKSHVERVVTAEELYKK